MKTKDLFKYNPRKELMAVLVNYILIVAMFYVSFQIITIKNVAAQFITFGILGILLLGVMTPALYSTLIMKRSLSVLGIKKEKFLFSVGLCFAFSLVQYFMTLAKLELPEFMSLVPLMSMLLAVGLFENIFFRGFVQMRFEESFGIIPGIVISAALYCLYHIGYGMEGSEFLILFAIGLIYSTIFRLTTNLFILYPVLTPMGALFTNIKEGMIIPFEATIGFTLVMILAIGGLLTIHKVYKKQQIKILKSTN